MTVGNEPSGAAEDGVVPEEALAEARAAIDRHAWRAAFDAFTAADAQGPGQVTLSGEDLEAFALSAYFSAQPDVVVDARERAFKAHLAAGDKSRAATVALLLARDLGYQGMGSIAAAWIKRAERALEGTSGTVGHGHLALARGLEATIAGDIEGAIALAEEGAVIGTQTGDADLEAIALADLGALKIATGATREGLALMEEATIAAVNGDLSPFITGVTYCRMIAACRDLTDYRRASEWTEATERWCERQSVSGFPGVCRIHRAEVVALSGAWERAEGELRQATAELETYRATPPMADGFYALALIRFRRGDLEGAETALRDAHARGRDPQPLLAQVRLAQGRTSAALTAIDAAVEEAWDHWVKVRLLPAQVEIAIAAGDGAKARRAADELARLVGDYEAPATQGAVHDARGRVALAEGEPVEAAREFRRAIDRWREVAAPYEVAQTQLRLAAALRTIDEDAADLELDAARARFVQLGAALDVAAADKAAEIAAERRSVPVQVHRTFMFTDIVGSTTLVETLGNEAWEGLLRRHDDLLRPRFARAGGVIVNSTGDGFFVAFESARAAVDCAADIQRTLVAQRRGGGPALSLRIGLHTADASRHGQDYSGMGVHVAARVGAAAASGEILATVDTLTEIGDLDVLDRRMMELRGVSAPIEVVSISWT